MTTQRSIKIERIEMVLREPVHATASTRQSQYFLESARSRGILTTPGKLGKPGCHSEFDSAQAFRLPLVTKLLHRREGEAVAEP